MLSLLPIPRQLIGFQMAEERTLLNAVSLVRHKVVSATAIFSDLLK